MDGTVMTTGWFLVIYWWAVLSGISEFHPYWWINFNIKIKSSLLLTTWWRHSKLSLRCGEVVQYFWVLIYVDVCNPFQESGQGGEIVHQEYPEPIDVAALAMRQQKDSHPPHPAGPVIPEQPSNDNFSLPPDVAQMLSAMSQQQQMPQQQQQQNQLGMNSSMTPDQMQAFMNSNMQQIFSTIMVRKDSLLLC